MKKTVLTILIVLGLALILVAASTLAFPDWLKGAPGGLLALLGVALVAVAGIGGKLKDWRELLFPEEKKKEKSASPAQVPQRTQEMSGSEDGEQAMHGKGGIQKQKMNDSPRGKQTMD